jgi:hypothetical protein
VRTVHFILRALYFVERPPVPFWVDPTACWSRWHLSFRRESNCGSSDRCLIIFLNELSRLLYPLHNLYQNVLPKDAAEMNLQMDLQVSGRLWWS